MGAVQLPDAAAGIIALHRVAQLQSGGDDQSIDWLAGSSTVDDEIRGDSTFSSVIQPAKLIILF